MTDGGAVFRPATGRAPAPLRPRSVYAGLDAFGDGDGAVLVESRVVRNLRLAAEFAAQEGRIAGGLLYGRSFVDEKGAYLVISGYLEAGPGENPGDQASREGYGEFTLSEPDLRLLRRDAARMYTSSVEAGWWRTLPAPGAFGPRDLETQRALVGPGGAGLLVFGSGLDWGTAYLGPDALPPDTSGLAPPTPRLAPESPGDLEPEGVRARGVEPALGDLPVAEYEAGYEVEDEAGHEPAAAPVADAFAAAEPELEAEPSFMDDLGFEEAPDLVADPGFTDDSYDEGFDDDGFDDDTGLDAGPDLDAPSADEPTAPVTPVTVLATHRQPVLTPAPQPTGQREVSPVHKPQQEWGVKEPNPSYVGPETPTDVKIVVGLLCLVVIAAAIMIGMLVSDALASVIVGVVGFLVIVAFLWFSRL
jgi:hypothetical protein